MCASILTTIALPMPAISVLVRHEAAHCRGHANLMTHSECALDQ
jgi:hypothetical protein